jgi:hypothetical protein
MPNRAFAGLLAAIAAFAVFGVASLGFYASVGGLLIACGTSVLVGAATVLLMGRRLR